MRKRLLNNEDKEELKYCAECKVSFTEEQELTEEQKAIARKNIGVGEGSGSGVSDEQLQEAVNAALAQAKESGEFDGADGQDGAPGKDGQDGQPGADGTSVTVESVSESEEDGGENVVTFSDGKTLTVKNGKTGVTGAKGDKGDTGATGAAGADGAPGKSAYAYAQDGGYTGTEDEFAKMAAALVTEKDIVQEAGQSESLVMSQKAVTDLVADALGTGEETTEYETVDSVEEMTDTSKQYVLSSTGTLWAYGEQGEPTPQFTNLADPTSSDWSEGNRFNSSGVLTAQDGFVATNYIAASNGDVIRVQGMDLNTHTYARVATFNSSRAIQSSSKISQSSGLADVTYDTDSAQFAISAGSVSYVRFCAPLVSSADIIITKNEEITYSAGSVWYDTGMTPETGNSGGNYVKLLVKVNQNAADIAHNSERITALETGADSLVIPSFWSDAVEACISKIKALQVGKNCVTFPFFSDNHTRDGNAQYMGVMIAYIMRECGIPYCFCGGDVISSAYIDSEGTMIAQDAAFDMAMSYIPNGRFCRAVGNHDGYWAVSASEKHWYTRAQIYDLFLREEGIAQNKHFGEDGTYYYVDDIASKVRWIVLNTNTEGGGESIDSVQFAWMQNTALKFSESGWGVVFISHHPISNHYHANVSNAATVISFVNDYVNGTDADKADIIGWFSGHIHRDRIFSGFSVNDTDDSEGDVMPFKQVTITSDHTTIAYDDATKHTVANDDQSHAIDFVTINRGTRTVHLTRLGIGEDRSYTY